LGDEVMKFFNESRKRVLVKKEDSKENSDDEENEDDKLRNLEKAI
jgi:hypothetical protein